MWIPILFKEESPIKDKHNDKTAFLEMKPTKKG